MSARMWHSITWPGVVIACSAWIPANAAGQQPASQATSFRHLHSVTPEAGRSAAIAWLQTTGKTDPDIMRRVESIWKDESVPVLDRTVAVLALGNVQAAQLLAQAASNSQAAPTKVPSVLVDLKQPAFFRANLALAYGRALCRRRVYEEALGAFRTIDPEQVVDPAAYFFYRAVAEYGLALKTDAMRSITGLLEDVSDTPDRYRVVAVLMQQDVKRWKDKDLGEIARKMQNIERRLELARGGQQTQKMQRDVLARIDELIKRLEEQSKNAAESMPAGGQQSPSPMQDSHIATNTGPGKLDDKKLRGLAQQWGKLPEKVRAQAMQDLIKQMPDRDREVIESYFKKLAQSPPSQP